MIYFIQHGKDGPIKVGVSTQIRTRLRQMQNDCPYDLTLLGVMAGGLVEEARLHLRFGKWRVRGEWFEPVPELLNFIAQNAVRLEPIFRKMRGERSSLEHRAREWRRRKAEEYRYQV